FFFFSSRRRHTRSKRDWSSDVCSSDLNVPSKINIIDNVDVKDSALPEEILKLRRSDFYQEQKVKDQILRKLNVKIDRDKKKAEKIGRASCRERVKIKEGAV